MKTLLFSTVVILCVMVNSALCQEGEGSDTSMVNRMKKWFMRMMDDVKSGLMELKEELKARAADMRDWSREMFENFKKKMNEWINEESGASDAEKNEMKEYLERMQMERQ